MENTCRNLGKKTSKLPPTKKDTHTQKPLGFSTSNNRRFRWHQAGDHARELRQGPRGVVHRGAREGAGDRVAAEGRLRGAGGLEKTSKKRKEKYGCLWALKKFWLFGGGFGCFGWLFLVFAGGFACFGWLFFWCFPDVLTVFGCFWVLAFSYCIFGGGGWWGLFLVFLFGGFWKSVVTAQFHRLRRANHVGEAQRQHFLTSIDVIAIGCSQIFADGDRLHVADQTSLGIKQDKVSYLDSSTPISWELFCCFKKTLQEHASSWWSSIISSTSFHPKARCH